jgi:transposase
MKERPHPEQGYRSCLGLLRLGERYGKERLEAACARALRVKATSYRSVQSILQRGLDQVADEQTVLTLPQNHENVRGAGYYAAATGEL